MASHCVYKSHLRAGPPCPAVLGQHTHTQSQWCFFLNFCFILLCKSIVYLSDLLPIYYVFRVCIFTDSVFMCGSCALSLSFFFLPPFLPPSVCLFFLVHLFVYLPVCFPKGERKRRCGENGWGDEEDLGGDGKGKTRIRHTVWIFSKNNNKICHVNVHSNWNHFAKSKYSSAGGWPMHFLLRMLKSCGTQLKVS